MDAQGITTAGFHLAEGSLVEGLQDHAGEDVLDVFDFWDEGF